MLFFQSPLVLVCLCFIGGMIFARGYPFILPLMGVFFILKKEKTPPLILLLVFLLGFLAWGQAVINYERDFLHEIAGEKVNFRGRLKEKEDKRFLVDRISLKAAGGWKEIEGKYWTWLDRGEKFKVGDLIKAKGTFYPHSAPSNPGEPDWRMHNLAQGIRGSINIENRTSKAIDFKPSPLIKVREYFRDRMGKTLGKEKGNFLAALLLGQRRALGTEQRENFYSAGLGHILAVSGLHIGFIALLLWIIVDKVPLGSKGKTTLFCLFIFLYMILVGLRASVVRAGIMAIGLRVGKEMGRDQNLFNHLCLAAIIILVSNPFQLWTPGFQLSFLITFFIVLGKRNLFKINGRLKQGVFVSILATLAASPLTAFHFHTINPLNFLGNIWALPVTGVIVMSGFCGLIPGIGDFIWRLITLPGIMVMERILEIWVALPGTSLIVPPPPFWAMGLFYFSFIFVLFWIEPTNLLIWRRYKNFLAKKIIPIIISIFLAFSFIPSRESEKTRITFLDVGQGDAIHVSIPGIGNFMVDAGGERDQVELGVGERVILPYLRAQGVKGLEAIFISHFHQDHYRGFLPVLGEKSPEMVFGPPIQGVWQEEEFFLELEREAINYTPLKRGHHFHLAPDVNIEVLHPGKALINPSELNNNSLVLNLEVGDWNFLLTGDIEEEAERILVSKGILPRADILKVPHHGSSTSSTREFLEQVQPGFAVIQVGNNPFGHPDEQVIERLNKFGAEVYKTLDHGAIIFSISKEGKLKLKTWKGKNQNLFPFADNFEEIKSFLYIF